VPCLIRTCRSAPVWNVPKLSIVVDPNTPSEGTMNLRELIVGRILFACDEEILIRNHGITEDEVEELSDLDLFELFESVFLEEIK